MGPPTRSFWPTDLDFIIKMDSPHIVLWVPQLSYAVPNSLFMPNSLLLNLHSAEQAILS